jgi:hypothetical protein
LSGFLWPSAVAYRIIWPSDLTAVLENDLIAQSFLPAIGSRPKTKTSCITKLCFLAKMTNTEFFATNKNLKLSTRNNITV